MQQSKTCGRAVSHRSRGALPGFAVALACAILPQPAVGADATATITIQAQVSNRTSLQISTENLHFDVVSPAEPATAAVDFSAAARTHAGAEVVLSVEVLNTIARRNNPGETGTALSFAGHGEGTRGGVVDATNSSVAARWTGSGHRRGRIVFALGTRAPGTYTVPVRFVLTAP